MRPIARMFVDAAGWRAFLDRNDPYHQQAVALLRRAARRPASLITTNAVLAELFTSLTCQYELSRQRSVAMVEGVRRSSLVEVVHIDPTLEETAWQGLRAHPEHEWSLVDLTSFAVMRARRLTRALTSSPHYSQAGFTRLLV